MGWVGVYFDWYIRGSRKLYDNSINHEFWSQLAGVKDKTPLFLFVRVIFRVALKEMVKIDAIARTTTAFNSNFSTSIVGLFEAGVPRVRSQLGWTPRNSKSPSKQPLTQ